MSRVVRCLKGLVLVPTLLVAGGAPSPVTGAPPGARGSGSPSVAVGAPAAMPARGMPSAIAGAAPPGPSRSAAAGGAAGPHNPGATASGSPPPELTVDALEAAVASSGGPMDSTGAIGTNRGQYHTIGEQRSISPHVVHALLTGGVGELGMALTAMEYSFAHQLPDGSFQVVQFAGASFTLPAYDPVSVDFFLADLGHSLMLLDESSWFQTSAASAGLRQRLQALRPRIALSLRWLAQPRQVVTIQMDGRGGTNRLATACAAYLLVGRWAGDPTALQVGAAMTRAVIAREWVDGVLPENGGYDSMYQAVSLHHLGWIYLHLGTAQAWLRAPLAQAISRGVARERLSIQPGGAISTAGNTRVYCGGESFRGTPKGGDYRDVVLGFLYGSVIGDNALDLQLARSVATYYVQHAPPAAC